MKHLTLTLFLAICSLAMTAQVNMVVVNNSPFDVTMSALRADAGCSQIIPSVGPYTIPAGMPTVVSIPAAEVTALRFYTTCAVPADLTLGSLCCPLVPLPNAGTLTQICPNYTFSIVWDCNNQVVDIN